MISKISLSSRVAAAAVVAACTPAPTPAASGAALSAQATQSVQPEASPPPHPTASAAAEWKPSAAAYLDRRSKAWLTAPPRAGQRMSCALSCHTTHPYLFSRPHLGTSAVADELYAALTSRVGFDGPWAKQTPWYGQDGSQKARESLGSEAVLNAVTLALHDQARGRAPTPTTLRAVERMWEAQRSDGGFHWLDFGLEPWEAGNETWGAAMAALAAGLVGAETAGTESLRKFLKSRQSPTLHDRLAILWASTAMSGLADSDTLRDTFDAVVAAQAPSGGWSNAALIGSLPETGVDAYATAFATFVLCTFENAGRETGTVAPNQTAIGAGLTWLRKHQSSKGSWETTSANRESARGARFMTDAATAYAVLALTRCAP